MEVKENKITENKNYFTKKTKIFITFDYRVLTEKKKQQWNNNEIILNIEKKKGQKSCYLGDTVETNIIHLLFENFVYIKRTLLQFQVIFLRPVKNFFRSFNYAFFDHLLFKKSSGYNESYIFSNFLQNLNKSQGRTDRRTSSVVRRWTLHLRSVKMFL